MPIFVKIKLVFPVLSILSELAYKGLLASSLAKTIICLGQICMRLSLRCQNFGVQSQPLTIAFAFLQFLGLAVLLGNYFKGKAERLLL